MPCKVYLPSECFISAGQNFASTVANSCLEVTTWVGSRHSYFSGLQMKAYLNRGKLPRKVSLLGTQCAVDQSSLLHIYVVRLTATSLVDEHLFAWSDSAELLYPAKKRHIFHLLSSIWLKNTILLYTINFFGPHEATGRNMSVFAGYCQTNQPTILNIIYYFIITII